MRVSFFFGLLSLFTALGCGSSHGVGDAGADDAAASDAGGADSGGADAGGAVDSGAVADASPAGDAGTVADAALSDAGATTDAGGSRDAGGTPMEIDCMGMTCDTATQQCCIMGGFGGASGSCIPRGSTCEGGTADCDGPEDCGANEVCCGSGDFSGVSAECRASSEPCGGPGVFSEFELCHETSDCTDDSAMCCPVMMFGFSIGICQPSCFGGGFPG